MIRKKIYIYLFLLTLFFILCVTGCKEKNGGNSEQTVIDTLIDTEGAEYNKDTIVLTVGGNKATYNEILLYFRSYKQKIEMLYGPDIWDYKLDEEGTTYADKLKDQILEEIKYIKIVCAQADDLDISLAEDEKMNVKEYTADYIANFTDSDLKYYEFTEETVKKIYEENLLANIIYERITLNVDTDIDEKEAKHIVLMYILIAKNTFDADGNMVFYSDEELDELKLFAEEIHQRTETEDFYTLAKEYSSDDDEIEITVCRGDMLPEFEEEVFGLKEGEVSNIIENDIGYFIFYCKSENDEAATESAKEKIITDRQNSAFYESFSVWENDTKVTLNEQVWDKINFNDL